MSLNRLVNNHSLTANDGGEAISINSFKTNTMKKDGSRDGPLTHSGWVKGRFYDPFKNSGN